MQKGTRGWSLYSNGIHLLKILKHYWLLYSLDGWYWLHRGWMRIANICDATCSQHDIWLSHPAIWVSRYRYIILSYSKIFVFFFIVDGQHDIMSWLFVIWISGAKVSMWKVFFMGIEILKNYVPFSDAW